MGLIAAGTMFAQPRVAIGIGVGGYAPGYYPPPPVYAQRYVPPCPGPDYTWVNGYWNQGVWVGGFWRAPFAGGYRVAPRYYNSFRGYDHGRFEHEHFDRDRGYSRGFRR